MESLGPARRTHVDSIGERRAAPQIPSSPMPLLFRRIGPVIELGKENRVQFGNISVNRNMVLGEVMIDEIPEARVESRRFPQCGSDTKVIPPIAWDRAVSRSGHGRP